MRTKLRVHNQEFTNTKVLAAIIKIEKHNNHIDYWTNDISLLVRTTK